MCACLYVRVYVRFCSIVYAYECVCVGSGGMRPPSFQEARFCDDLRMIWADDFGMIKDNAKLAAEIVSNRKRKW